MFPKLIAITQIIVFAAFTASAQGGKIVFTSNRDGNFEIYIMNPDGTSQTRVTNNTFHDSRPDISPDGRKVVFQSVRSGNVDIYIVNADGTGEQRLTTHSGVDDAPEFSPDGNKIVFSGNDEIRIMNIDGSGNIALTSNTARDGSPSFSPDGSKIVFSSDRDPETTPFQIWVMNTDGSDPTRLTNDTFNCSTPEISPDGTKIAFSGFAPESAYGPQGAMNLTPEGGTSDIFIMNSDGTNRLRLTNAPDSDDLPTFSPDGVKIAFSSNRNNVGFPNIWVMNSDGSNQTQLTSAGDFQPSWGQSALRPVLIVPGIAGTYAASTSNDTNWLLNRGAAPTQLQVDPLARVYHDLIRTFENVGYVRDRDLFVVNYDWRLVPGPRDGSFDGVINGITAASISDENFQYGVDYLGLALKKAYERWEEDHNGATLEEVDIVAHSTGGLVSRTYIQSPAYNAAFSGTKKLPKVKNMIMMGVPNRGASKAWNALHDNWNADIAYRYVLSKIINRAYLKVLLGNTITGPDHTINLASITDGAGEASHTMFIRQYVPTIRSLLATYDFVDFGDGYGDVNSDAAFSNDWVLDLNNGLDHIPNGDDSLFANNCSPTIIYASGHETPTFVTRILGGGENVVFNFDDLFAGHVPNGIPWFMEIPGQNGGDGTVPVISSTGQFAGDSRVSLKQITSGNPDHTGIMSNLDAQRTILETVETNFQTSQISTGLAGPQAGAVISVISDPVDGFVIDAKGRRLGYSDATGALTEIPGSVWFGDSDGAGWVFGGIERPLRVELTGRGEPFYFEVAVHDLDADGGVVDSGFLAKGEKKVLPVAVGTASISGRVTDSRGRGLKGAFVYLSDGRNTQITTYSNSFGYYRFFNVPAEVEYQLTVVSKRYAIDPAARNIDLLYDVADVDFAATPLTVRTAILENALRPRW